MILLPLPPECWDYKHVLSILLLLLFILFVEPGSLSMYVCSGTCYIDQANLKLRAPPSNASASQCATTPGLCILFMKGIPHEF